MSKCGPMQPRWRSVFLLGCIQSTLLPWAPSPNRLARLSSRCHLTPLLVPSAYVLRSISIQPLIDDKGADIIAQAASAFATLAYVIASHWIVTGRSVTRDLTIDGPSGSLAFHFNHLPGHTATHSMAAAYALSNSTDPMLVASHNCS